MSYSYVRIGSLAELHLAECDGTLKRGRRVIVRTNRGVELGEVIRPAVEPVAEPAVEAATERVGQASQECSPGDAESSVDLTAAEKASDRDASKAPVPKALVPRTPDSGSRASSFQNGSSPVPRARVLRPTTEEDELLIRRLERHKREAVEACRDALSEAGSTAMLLDVDQLFDGGTLVMHFLGPVDEIASGITKEVSDRYESIVRSRHFAKLLADGCGPDCGQKEGGCGGGCAGCAVSSACKSG